MCKVHQICADMQNGRTGVFWVQNPQLMDQNHPLLFFGAFCVPFPSCLRNFTLQKILCKWLMHQLIGKQLKSSQILAIIGISNYCTVDSRLSSHIILMILILLSQKLKWKVLVNKTSDRILVLAITRISLHIHRHSKLKSGKGIEVYWENDEPIILER